jgi:uncharacterized membrane protein YphA (DoxX/SURF4 family)
MGMLRMAVAAILLVDFLSLGFSDLVVPLIADPTAGGWGTTGGLDSGYWLYAVLPQTVASAWWVYGVMLAATTCLLLGVFPRLAALVLVMVWAQVAMLVPASDRGIDMLLRNVLWVLVFCPCGAWGSLQARWRTGSWLGDGEAIPAWPRHLLIVQLVVMYFTAGVQKVGFYWMPFGDFAALYVILQDWAVARVDFGFLGLPLPYFLTQVGTVVTMVWEWTFPVVLWVNIGRWRGERAGPWLRWAVTQRIDRVWIGVGVLFHIGILLTLQLGIFAPAMLALYVCFIHPEDWPRIRLRRPVSSDS